MAGSLMAAKASCRRRCCRPSATPAPAPHPKGRYFEVALSDAAAYVALPRRWGITQPAGAVGGAHAGYRIYPCRDGRVAVAALEPHFAAALCEAAGVASSDMKAMFDARTRDAIATFLESQTRAELDQLAVDRDLPLHTMAP